MKLEEDAKRRQQRERASVWDDFLSAHTYSEYRCTHTRAKSSVWC